MNTVLEKGNIIAKIRRGEDLEQIIDYVKSEIYQNGPNSSVVLEIVSYFKLFQPEFQEGRARNNCHDGAVFQTTKN